VKPAPFEYHRPSTVDEAIGLLGELGDEAKVLAGGQSLVPMLNLRLARFEHLIDLNGVEGLDGVDAGGEDISLGALVRVHDVALGAVSAVPLLTQAARLVGHPAIRHRGTVAGSIAHADPAAELPTAALVLDAVITAIGPAGRRDIPAASFFVDYWQTALEPDEIITSVRVPIPTTPGSMAVRELTRRHGDFAIAGAMCQLDLDGDSIRSASIGLFGMGPTPLRATAAEHALLGQRTSSLDLTDVVVTPEHVHPSTDVHATAEYRMRVCNHLLVEVVTAACEDGAR